ncbi:unnamed protein product [Pedinophyceae sp. YPF-701]|nr:unnamed protein product [Pedinophyceae sp. YPF-701]
MGHGGKERMRTSADAGSGGAVGALGQSFNATGMLQFLSILGSQKSLAIPHVDVPDIRWLDWAAMRDAGIRACVFDKDNTLTAPYALEVYPDVSEAVAECLRVFGAEKVAILSNSAGLKQFDPDGAEAQAVEDALGVHVLRHTEKKPGGSAREAAAHLGCAEEEIAFIGDRYLTDTVYGNRNGLLTVRVAALTKLGEKKTVRAARKLEESLVAKWRRKGKQAPAHATISAEQIAKMVREPGCW